MDEQVGEQQEVTAEPTDAPSASGDSPPQSIDALVAALGDDGETSAADTVDTPDASTGEATEGEVQTTDAAEPTPAGSETVELVESLPIDPDDDLRGVEGEASRRLMSIVESLLFAANRPLKVREIRKVLRSEPSKRQIQLALKQLEEETAGRGVVLRQVAGGFVLRTNPANAAFVQRLLQARPVRLSRPQLETLAVVVYRQPITRAEIDHVRGVDSGAVLKLLMERDLIKIVGRKEEPGRPMLYGTTVKFLEFFDLKSLRDLPDLREFTELSEVSKDRLRDTMPEDELEIFGQEVIDFARASDPAEGEVEAGIDTEGAATDDADDGQDAQYADAQDDAANGAAEDEGATETNASDGEGGEDDEGAGDGEGAEVGDVGEVGEDVPDAEEPDAPDAEVADAEVEPT